MKKEITPSDFYHFIETHNISAAFVTHFAIVRIGKRVNFQITDVDIEGENNDWLHIAPFADYTFTNVTLKNLSYTGEVSVHDKLVSPVLSFHECVISSLEVRGVVDSMVSLNRCDISGELRVYGKAQSLQIYLTKDNSISSIWLGQEQREDGGALAITIGSEEKLAYQIQHIEIDNLPVVIRALDVGIKNLRIDSYYHVGVELAKCTIESIKLEQFIGEFGANKSAIGEFMSPREISENTKFRFQGSLIDVCVFNTKDNFQAISFEKNCEIGKLILKRGSINDVQIRGCNIDLFYLDIGRFNFKELIVSKSIDFTTHINHLIFSGGISKNPIKLEDFSVSRLSFISLINKSDIFVTGICYANSMDVKTPKLIDYAFPLNEYSIFVGKRSEIEVNRKYETFIDTDVSDVLEVFNSDLGKINFISCDFSEMKLIFKASKLTEIFLSGSEMPEQLVGNYQDRQVGYAQLKKVYDNRGDSVKSNDYLARELDAHYQSLKTENLQKENPAFKERTWTQWFDYVTLKIHKNSNNFGTSWRTSLWWVLLGSLPLYLAYAWTIGYVPTWPWRENAMFYGWEISSFFIEFLFPIHKADFIPEAVDLKPNSFSRILESLGRLLNGYIIYQFIAAFRKYGKK